MSLTMVAVHLVIALIILLGLIMKGKIEATISIVIASLYMGIACGLGLMPTATTIVDGFGGMMRGIGLPIGFGVILGQLLSDCGGAYVIADRITKAFPAARAFIALLITAAILSIPVFADVTFVILMPIGIALCRKTNLPIALAVAVISMGAVATHTWVPPTPGPLTVAELVHTDVGVLIMVGLVVTFFSLLLSYGLVKAMMNGKWFMKDSDINPNAILIEGSDFEKHGSLPGFGLSMLPIIVPVLLILLGTGVAMATKNVPEVVKFLGDKMIALLIGAIIAFYIAIKHLTADERGKSVTRALASCGMILLVTGAGGSFGAVIKATGIGDLLMAILGTDSQAVIPALLITFFVGVVFRVSLGSGTAASITAATIIAPIMGNLPVHPVYIALAALSGGMSFPHVNDSGYWVMTNLGGLTVKGGIKAYSIPILITSLFGFACVLAMASFFPMAS